MNKIIQILNQPYLGTCEPKRELLEHIYIGGFVTIFLWFFEPFGLDGYRGNKFVLALKFGLVTYIVGALYHLGAYYILGIRQDRPSWKFWKWIVLTLILILCIAIGNFLLFNYLSEWNDISWFVFLSFVKNTLAVGIFPVVVSGLINIIRNERKFQQEAILANQQLPPEYVHEDSTSIASEIIEIPSQSDQQVQLPKGTINYLQAMENYVAIYYEGEDGPEKTLVRNTLKAIDDSLPSDHFLRCHRSYVVNLDKIQQIDGNAQGLMLRLTGLPNTEFVPVSRKYIPLLKTKLALSKAG